ncbi:MAG TPA: cellulase family glycosylhydrolase [Burkholderiales bacterium]|nr:cellulase family glycosylhydrolase [Burkholderiales bacterium]
MLGLICVVLSCAASMATAQDCGGPLTGINMAGAEFGKNVPGREGADYRFPSGRQIEYFARLGFKSMRLPVRWERLQPELGGDLDERYLIGIVNFLNEAARNDMTVIVDLHNYARYNNQVIGSEGVSAFAFQNVWQRIALALNGHRALLGYGLMNEPNRTGGLWHRVAQSGVDGIRSVDRVHRIYVSGEQFSSASSWPKVNPQPFVNDPVKLEVYEGHIYFDADSSGRYASPEPPADPAQLVDARLRPFMQWLAEYNKQGIIGEWGVPSDDARWFPVAQRMVEFSRENCLPTFIWAGGTWSPGYKLSLEPRNGMERALTRHLASLMHRLAN